MYNLYLRWWALGPGTLCTFPGGRKEPQRSALGFSFGLVVGSPQPANLLPIYRKFRPPAVESPCPVLVKSSCLVLSYVCKILYGAAPHVLFISLVTAPRFRPGTVVFMQLIFKENLQVKTCAAAPTYCHVFCLCCTPSLFLAASQMRLTAVSP